MKIAILTCYYFRMLEITQITKRIYASNYVDWINLLCNNHNLESWVTLSQECLHRKYWYKQYHSNPEKEDSRLRIWINLGVVCVYSLHRNVNCWSCQLDDLIVQSSSSLPVYCDTRKHLITETAAYLMKLLVALQWISRWTIISAKVRFVAWP